ncbi:MAG: glycosyltransferase [Azoarcus sp.]|jgi:glycosyltransferase involved in cell wall biosynthesis|nr:glycosyltransferase [Azoarcus sp.]
MALSTARGILQICHGYDGPFLDCARQYARLFRDSPYQVVTVYLTGEPDERVVRGSASDEVIFLRFRSAEIRGLKLKAIREVRRIAARRDFAFCIAHRFKPVYTALLGTNLPVIGVHHAFGDYRRLSRRAFAQTFKKRLRLLGVSEAVRDDLRVDLPSWPPSHIEALYNRVDVAALQAGLLSREEARAALDLPPEGWIVGNVGRLHPDKDQATLIRAFAAALPALPAGSLLAIMGSGRLARELKSLAARQGIAASVRFLGQVPDGRRYFSAFDVFALSSDREPFGMVLLEALAAGLPVVCSDCGGGREVVAGVGELFPFGDAAALAGALSRLAESGIPEDYAERAEKHLRMKFSDEASAEVYWKLPMIVELTRGESC